MCVKGTQQGVRVGNEGGEEWTEGGTSKLHINDKVHPNRISQWVSPTVKCHLQGARKCLQLVSRSLPWCTWIVAASLVHVSARGFQIWSAAPNP